MLQFDKLGKLNNAVIHNGQNKGQNNVSKLKLGKDL